MPATVARAVITSQTIPKALAEKFAAITTLTDAFCAKHLDEGPDSPYPRRAIWEH